MPAWMKDGMRTDLNNTDPPIAYWKTKTRLYGEFKNGVRIRMAPRGVFRTECGLHSWENDDYGGVKKITIPPPLGTGYL